MAQALSKYSQRASRYEFQNDDRRVVRFAKVGTKNRSTSTILIDISQSGMAFLVDKKLKPDLGDTVMVEFTVPGSDQMACYAKVMRVDLRSPDTDHLKNKADEVVVAVRFLDLMNVHQKNLSSGLKKKFKELKSMNQREKILDTMEWAPKSYKNHIFWALSAVFMVFIFYFILQK